MSRICESFEIHIKKSLIDKIITDEVFNDLSDKENSYIKIRYIHSFDEKVKIMVDVVKFIKYCESNIISKLMKIYKNDIDIYNFSYNEHIYYENGSIKSVNLFEEKVKKANNRDKLIDIVKNNKEAYRFIPDKYKYDVSFNLEVIYSYDFLYWLPDEMKLNRDILFRCLTSYGYYYTPLDKYILKDCDVKEMIILAIKESNNDEFYHFESLIPKVLYSDKDFILKVLDVNNNFIVDIYDLLSNDLRIDKDIVEIYARSCFCDIKKIDKRFKKTDELVKKMIFSNCSNLKYTKFRNDFDFINLLLDNEHNVLGYTDKDIRCNYDIVLKSVKRFPSSLEFASDELRNNKEIVEWAMMSPYNRDKSIFKYAGDVVRNDLDFVNYLLDHDCDILEYVGDSIKNNYDIVLKSVKKFLNSLEYASDDVKNNLEFIDKLLEYNFDILKYVGDSVKNNFDIVLKSVKKFFYSLEYASDELKNNIDIVKTVVLNVGYDCNILKYIGKDLRNNKEFMMEFFDNCECRNIILNEYSKRRYNKLFKLDNYEFIIREFDVSDGDEFDDRKCLFINEFVYYIGDELLKDKDFIRYIIDKEIEKVLPF